MFKEIQINSEEIVSVFTFALKMHKELEDAAKTKVQLDKENYNKAFKNAMERHNLEYALYQEQLKKYSDYRKELITSEIFQKCLRQALEFSQKQKRLLQDELMQYQKYYNMLHSIKVMVKDVE